MSSSGRGDVGRTGVSKLDSEKETPKKKATLNITKDKDGNEILKGACSYPGCPYEDKSELRTNMGVVSLKNTEYKFHPECHTRWVNEARGTTNQFQYEDRIKALGQTD